MSGTAHPEPNYMGVFWWLLALTIIEVAVIYLPIAKLAIAIMLITLAITKAALVALYFMHLKFERRTLALVA
ncbi:MAG TPA: cytochrome C oxidase subunit IV family protein, partial [Candidatus Binatia bacterium]|nr:cytochrome C oxidase subunit IV family protein [Candidatus Binatia bacterium]